MASQLIQDARDNMQKTVEAYSRDILTIRTGRASSSMLDGLKVEYYGFPTPLIEVAQVSCPEPRQILIKPYEKDSLKDIEAAIKKSSLGLVPLNDGSVIRLNIPALTEERRKEFVKMLGKKSEDAKVAIRNIRRRLNDVLKKDKSVSEDQTRREEQDLQKATDEFIKKIEDLQKAKEKEITTI